MLEIGVDYLDKHNAVAIIEIKNNGSESIFFELIVNSTRISKRLIKLERNGQFSITLDGFQKNINHLALVPVTSEFAENRMLKKLVALHPRYKNKGNKENFLSSMKDTIWLDYCKLFSFKKNLISYCDWINEFDNINEKDYPKIDDAIDRLTEKPLLLIIMDFSFEEVTSIYIFVKSIKKQRYKNWILLINIIGIQEEEYRSLIEKEIEVEVDNRIKLSFSKIQFDANLITDSDWTIILESKGIVAEQALFFIAYSIVTNPKCDLFYGDHDLIDASGTRYNPNFKSAWDLDLLYARNNTIAPLGIYKTSLLQKINYNSIIEFNSNTFNLELKYIELIGHHSINHIPRILYHNYKISTSLDIKSNCNLYGTSFHPEILDNHFPRCGIKAVAEKGLFSNRVCYLIPTTPPLVSLIIPTRNGLHLLMRCIESIQLKTNYKNIEIIIVDNGSNDLATLQYLEKLALNPLIQVLRDNRPFNYSALNNAAVKAARGEIIGLINNDVEVINADWLSEMVSHALRPGVAAVGARLWYSDDTLQHAGVVLGIHGIAGHVHRFLPRHDVGYCGRASLIQSFSAVTAACLVVRKSIYEELGGLNETELPVACNDVDFCLRAREAGYKNIWTPYAELYHHESASRGFDDTPEKQARSAKEVAYMKQRWGDALLNDPAYSPNLTLDSEDFGLAWPPRVPSLDDVLSALEQANQASTLSSTSLQ